MGVLDEFKPCPEVTINYRELKLLIRKAERFEILADLVLDGATLNNNMDALQPDPEKTAALDFLRVVRFEEYNEKYTMEHNVNAGCDEDPHVFSIDAAPLSEEEMKRLSKELFGEGRVTVG